MGGFDYDVVIVGSGFGGSVSALRLVEKGYSVAVLEAGRRWRDQDFPKNSWHAKDFLWAPKLGMYGLQRIHFLPDSVILAGAGVGGGSLVYANTLYVPPESFFADPLWSGITDWADELHPWYDQAKRMLGVVQNPTMTPADVAMKAVADEMGVGETFRLTPVGVYFGEGAGVEHADPFFGGVGPARKGCIECGECMTGCRHNAKNTLPKNYLGLAEGAGAVVHPLTTVDAVRPLEGGGYAVEVHATGPSKRKGRRSYTAEQVIVSAGTYNTQALLHRMKDEGILPRLSDKLGVYSRTNSESLIGAVADKVPDLEGQDYSHGVAITSSFFPEPHTHIEPVRYGKGSNSLGLLGTVLTDGSDSEKRWKTWLKEVVRHPGDAAKSLWVKEWSQRGIIALVMQNLDNSITVSGKRTRLGWRLTSRQGEGEPNPTWIPAGNDATRRLARVIKGRPMGNLGDPVGAPFTAHFVGGCVMGIDADHGVIDPYHRVHGHPGLHIVDGSTVTANLGVNPSLTITALAERAISMWPNKGEDDQRPELGQPYLRIAAIEPKNPVVPAEAPAALRGPVDLGMPKVPSQTAD